MRRSFIEKLVGLAERDERIVLLAADLGYTVIEPFTERFPDRFFNTGVSEQNTVGVATGLAASGFIPFVYSIAPFSSARPYEFIRNGPVMHRLPVRIIGIGGGFEYGHAGWTHHGFDDIGLMRMLPGMTVVAPSDYRQACSALESTYDLPGPVYFRLGKDDDFELDGLDGRFILGRANLVRDSRQAFFIASGSIAGEAALATGILDEKHLSCGLIVVPSLNPFADDDICAAAARVRAIVTVETHVSPGGLGEAVASAIASRGLSCRISQCAVRTPYDGVSGSGAFLLKRHGLDAESLAKTMTELLGADAGD